MRMAMKSGGRVLSVASECVPLIKTGGLADVVGALPGALAPLGWEMRVLLPCYRPLKAAAAGWSVVWHGAEVFGGAGRVVAGVVGVWVLVLVEVGGCCGGWVFFFLDYGSLGSNEDRKSVV